MNHVLNITTNNTPAIVERLLQVTRYRGYELAGLELASHTDASSLCITLTVRSDKPIQLLTNQLHKLYDIQQLELVSADLAMLRA